MHRHGFKGRKFSLKKQPRELLLRNLATSVILHEKVKTTLPKAKEVQPIVEKMITLAKANNLVSSRRIYGYLLDEKAALKLQTEIVDLYKERIGGYTRITKFGFRSGDNAKMALIELLDVEKLDRKPKEEKRDSKETKMEISKKTALKKPIIKKTQIKDKK